MIGRNELNIDLGSSIHARRQTQIFSSIRVKRTQVMPRLTTPKSNLPEGYCLDFPLHKSVREVAEWTRRNVIMMVLWVHTVKKIGYRVFFQPGIRKINFLSPKNPHLREREREKERRKRKGKKEKIKKKKKLVTHRHYFSIADCRTKSPEIFTGIFTISAVFHIFYFLTTGSLAEPPTMFCESLVGVYRSGITVLLRRFGGGYPLFNNPKDHVRNTRREKLKKAHQRIKLHDKNNKWQDGPNNMCVDNRAPLQNYMQIIASNNVKCCRPIQR